MLYRLSFLASILLMLCYNSDCQSITLTPKASISKDNTLGINLSANGDLIYFNSTSGTGFVSQNEGVTWEEIVIPDSLRVQSMRRLNEDVYVIRSWQRQLWVGNSNNWKLVDGLYVPNDNGQLNKDGILHYASGNSILTIDAETKVDTFVTLADVDYLDLKNNFYMARRKVGTGFRDYEYDYYDWDNNFLLTHTSQFDYRDSNGEFWLYNDATYFGHFGGYYPNGKISKYDQSQQQVENVINIDSPLTIVGTIGDKIYYLRQDELFKAYVFDFITQEENEFHLATTNLSIAGNVLYSISAACIVTYNRSDYNIEEILSPESPENFRTSTFKAMESDAQGNLYALVSGQLHRSVDEGLSWELLNGGVPVSDIEIVDDLLYILSQGKLWSSTDGGISFVMENDNFASTTRVIYVKGNNFIFNRYTYRPCFNQVCALGSSVYGFVFDGSTDRGLTMTQNYHDLHSIEYINGAPVSKAWYDLNFERRKSYETEEDIFFIGNEGYVTRINKNNLTREEMPFSDGSVGYFGQILNDGSIITRELKYGEVLDSDTIKLLSTPVRRFGLPYVSNGEGDYLLASNDHLYYAESKQDTLERLTVYMSSGQANDRIDIAKLGRVYTSVSNKMYFVTTNGRVYSTDWVVHDENNLEVRFIADENQNCIADQNEFEIFNQFISVTNETDSLFAISPIGINMSLPDGEWEVELNAQDDQWQSCQGEEYRVTLNGGQERTIDIPLFAQSYCPNISLDVSTARLRRCMDNQYLFTVINTGTAPSERMILRVTSDPFFEQVDFDAPFSETSEDNYELVLTNVGIGVEIQVKMSFVVDCEAELGQSHCLMVEADTRETCDVPVYTGASYLENIGAFDPNDMRVFNSEGFEDRYFDKGEYLYYQIRFQNTGTDTAFNVNLVSSLPDNLDLTTFEFLSSSHTSDYTIKPGRVLDVQYDNILLPDDKVDELGSNGSFRFRIKPKRTIDYEEIIQCRAEIFFDFNAGIITNTAVAQIHPLCQNPPVITEIESDLCPNRIVEGYRNAGRYRDVFLTEDGCDSIRFLTVIERPVYSDTIEVTICEGDSYEGHWIEGLRLVRKQSQYGCDSNIYVDLKVIDRITLDPESVEICEGDNYEGYDTPGYHNIEYPNGDECPPVKRVHITIIPAPVEQQHITICQGDDYEGYDASGIYTDTIATLNGCDSIRTLHLSVTEEVMNEVRVELCQGEVYEGYSVSGTYTEVYTATNGCDSTRILHLDVTPAFDRNLAITLCAGGSYEGYSTQGIYRDTFSTVSGCDSIRTIDLTILQPIESEYDVTICEDEIYDGYTVSGTYEDRFTSSRGCDSVRILNLDVLENTHNIQTVDLCIGEEYQGYSEEGVYDEIYSSARGCDSIRTVVVRHIERSDPICAFRYDYAPKPFDESSFLSFYPNPVADMAELSIGKSSRLPATLRITTIDQEILMEKTITDFNTQLDFSSLHQGVYLVYLQSGNNVFYDVFVKI